MKMKDQLTTVRAIAKLERVKADIGEVANLHGSVLLLTEVIDTLNELAGE